MLLSIREKECTLRVLECFSKVAPVPLLWQVYYAGVLEKDCLLFQMALPLIHPRSNDMDALQWSIALPSQPLLPSYLSPRSRPSKLSCTRKTCSFPAPPLPVSEFPSSCCFYSIHSQNYGGHPCAEQLHVIQTLLHYMPY